MNKVVTKKKDFNDVTAAPFSMCFFAAGSWENDIENWAAVMSVRSFLFRDNFSICKTFYQMSYKKFLDTYIDW